ncbi:MAG: FG-GAP-like repeat-containing protein [Ignavibacteriales bacterium]|nr:FG-GAP-like repeat-containing protein [Ignavibacteriales bacterium]
MDTSNAFRSLWLVFWVGTILWSGEVHGADMITVSVSASATLGTLVTVGSTAFQEKDKLFDDEINSNVPQRTTDKVLERGNKLSRTGTIPTIVSVFPKSGPVGSIVTIQGTNFSSVVANNAVFFGAVRATVIAATTQSLQVKVPAGSTYKPISVCANGLTAYSLLPFAVTFSRTQDLTVSSFGSQVNYRQATEMFGMDIADFTGDGKPDIVVGNSNNNSISVLKNMSQPYQIDASSFGLGAIQNIGLSSWSALAEDFDGDGNKDIAIASYTNVSISRNTGQGGPITSWFDPSFDVAGGRTSMVSFCAHDLDGDGKPDLVAPMQYPAQNQITILRNTSSPGVMNAASFADTLILQSGNDPRSIDVGDLDGDGLPDIVVANYADNTFSVLRNAGSSGRITRSAFPSRLDLPTGTNPNHVILADIDGDGKLDIVITNLTSGTVSVIRNISVAGSLAAGSFAAKVDFSVGANCYMSAIGDLDGDGKVDIAVAGQGNFGTTILRNQSTPGVIDSNSFAPGFKISSSHTQRGICVCDVDGDGVPDIVFVSQFIVSVSIFRNQVADAPKMSAAELSAPSNTSTSISTSPLLSWKGVDGATSFRIQVSTSSSFTTTLVDDSTLLTGSKQITGLLNNTIYYWRVCGLNWGGQGPYSSTWSFTTVKAPPISVALFSPPNGSSGITNNTLLSWTQIRDASGYAIQVSKSTSFTSLAFEDTTLTDVYRQVSTLQNGTTYYWRVRARNAGGYGPYSPIWSFATVPAPPAAIGLQAPTNGSLSNSVSLSLVWFGISGVDSYHVQVSSDVNFSVLLVDDTALVSTAKQVGPFQNNTTYFWRVRGKNAGGYGTYSPTWSFTTIVAMSPQVTLISPLEGSAGIDINPMMSWNALSGATAYHFQLSTSSSFITLAIEDTAVLTTTRQLIGLQNGGSYFWRVRARNAAGFGPFSPTWSFTTIVAAPVAIVLQSPSNISKGLMITPVLTWLGLASSASYNLQLSQDADLGTLLIDDSGITQPSKQVGPLQNNTTYYWRVRGINAGGNGGFSSTWSFTTVVSLPQQVSLTSPANSATGVSTNPLLTWSQLSEASVYHLEVATSSSFLSLSTDDTTLAIPSRQLVALQNSTTYYWRVHASNGAGDGPYSSTWSFTTIIAAPSVAALQSPLNTSTGIITTPFLSWTSISTATSYHVQVSQDLNFSSLVVDDTTVTGTAKQIGPLQNNTTYYWRVRGKNAGGYGSYSPTWSLTTTVALPSTVMLSLPADGSVGVAVNPMVSWNGVMGAAVYHLELSTSPSFTVLVLEDSTSVTTSRQLAGLQNNTTYYWRMHGKNAAGDGPYSSTWSFTTIIAAPLAAVLQSPGNTATGITTAPTLIWSILSTATSYDLQVSSDVNFSSLVVDDTTLLGTSKQMGPLQNNTTYYWRVRGKNAGGYGPYSSTWSFATIVALPSIVVLSAPSDNAGGVPTSPVLRWSSVLTATTYRLQVSTSASFGTLVFEDSTLTGISQQLSSLQNSTAYYWHVCARNVAGYGPYSPTWSFTTVIAAPASATLQFPPNGSGGVPTSPTLSWTSLGAATNYHLQVSTDVSFASNLIDDTTLTATSRQIGPLQNNTIYQWRIRGKNAGGYGLYSSTWSFTTIPVYTPAVSVSTSLGFSTRAKASDYTPTDYKLFGLPGGSNLPVDSVFTGRENYDWQVYWDDGSSSNYMKKYDGSQTFRFTQGRAFWVIAKNAVNVSRTLGAATLNTNQEVEIPLQAGWNLITNPFNASTQWSKIQTINGTTAPIYSFSGVFNVSSTFDPYTGYYFFNGSPNAILTTLRVPYASLFTKTVEAPANSKGWRLQVQAGDSRVEIGVEPEAKPGLDAFDQRMPRAVGEISQVSLSREEWDKDYPTFRMDIRPQVNNIEKWNIELAAKAKTTTQIKVTGTETVPSQYEVYLVDQEGKRTQDLRKMQAYDCDVQSSKREISILVGTSELVRSEAEKSLPTEIKVGPNYPNPFNPETIIPIELPKAMDVTIVVYDILGRQVKVLQNGIMESGRHYMRWDGKDSNQSKVGTGVYFFRVECSGLRNFVVKMLIIQ